MDPCTDGEDFPRWTRGVPAGDREVEREELIVEVGTTTPSSASLDIQGCFIDSRISHTT